MNSERFGDFSIGVIVGASIMAVVIGLTSCTHPTEPPCPTVWEGHGDTTYNRGCVTGVKGGIEGVKK